MKTQETQASAAYLDVAGTAQLCAKYCEKSGDYRGRNAAIERCVTHLEKRDAVLKEQAEHPLDLKEFFTP